MGKLVPLVTLKRRAEFLVLARGKKLARPGFVMQIRRTGTGDPLRIGYTATKKIGDAVTRNRARRRLREAARLTLGPAGLNGFELVLICRQDTSTVPFEILQSSLSAAIAELTK